MSDKGQSEEQALVDAGRRAQAAIAKLKGLRIGAHHHIAIDDVLKMLEGQ